MMLSRYWDKYVATQAIIALAILLSTPFTRYTTPVAQVVGAILLLIGIATLIISAKRLGSAHTPVATPLEDAQLVTSGMHSVVRHPIYASVILLAIGWSLLWGSILSFIFSLILIAFFHFKTIREEFLLILKYLKYINYKKQVKKKNDSIYLLKNSLTSRLGRIKTYVWI